MLERLRRLRGVGLLINVHRRVGELGGNFQASAVTLALFLSLIPMIVVALAVLGFVSSGTDDFAAEAVESLGLTGDSAESLTEAIESAERNRGTASVIGFAGMVWSALGVVGAVQHVCNRAWQVEGRGFKDKLWAFGWLLGALVLLGGSVALSSLLNVLPGWAAPLNVLASLALMIAFFLWTFRVLTSRPLPLRAHLAGAVLGGIGFHILTVVGTTYVPDKVASSSAAFGAVGVIIALLGWLVLFGRLLVYAVALNVVRFEGDHGTVRVEVDAPRLDGDVPLEANRSAVVVKRIEAG